jgi:phage terminase small subunit
MAQAYELAEKDYILGLKYKAIAEKYGVSENTVKSWRKRHGWSRDKTAKIGAPIAPLKNQKGCTPKNKGKPEPEEERSDQEQLFCYHYVRTHNATQAALLSGYAKGGNKASAQVIGSRLYNRPRVRQEIDRLTELFRQDIHVNIQDFIAFCMKVVGADVGDYLTWGQKEVPVMGMFGPVINQETNEPLTKMVNYVDLGESEMLDTSVISEVKQGKDGISIKLADKKWAWEQLTKYFDWLPDQWQRKVEGERLTLESKKVKLMERKLGDDDDPKEDDNSFLEALKGKVPEVWDNGS